MRDKIEWLRLDEFVEIVAGNAPHDFRIARENFVFVLLRQPKHFAISAPFDGVGSALALDRVR